MNSSSIADVGVAIARKQARDQRQTREGQQPLQPGSRLQPQQTIRGNAATTITPRQNKNKRTWWSDLLQGLALYLLCLILPTLFAPIGLFYEKQTWVSNYVTTPLSRLLTRTIGAEAEWTDLGIIVVLSLSLAIIRIAIVNWLGEISGSEQLEAMVRCKSIHLLSSAYQESLTPTKAKKPIIIIDDMAPAMPSLTRSDSWLELKWEQVKLSSVKALGVDQPKLRLHAAPRYATAVFRCLYCATTITMALVCFRGSNFWPRILGGNGATANCWSLKGGVALDESFDFDDLNAKLKFYFLVQASYHIHSGAFLIIAKTILWYHQTGTKSNTKSYTSYGRSLLQHGIALLLILGAHLFSATRRLGAIGCFCLDVSSFVLHLLQACINHPTPFSPRVLQQLHRWLVIPVFLGMRFYVLPCCVWYSAAFESKDWLQQMESTMIPGMAKGMYGLFHVLMLVLLALNLVLLKRLLYHPHLQRLLDDGAQVTAGS